MLEALRWRWPDTDKYQKLTTEAAALVGDLQKRAEDAALLQRFQTAFPKDRLADILTLETYPLGTGQRETFSWWLERGLQKLGRYAPGSSRGHLLYKKTDGSWYQLKDEQNLAPDVYMQKVAQRHQHVVDVGGADTPAQLDQEHLVLGNSRVLRLLAAYYPDRFFPVFSTDHLRRILTQFGMPEDEVPAGPVARNLAVMALYKSLPVPEGVTVWDVMRLIYEKFSPRDIKLNLKRLRAAEQLFIWLFGAQGFENEGYLTRERNSKVNLAQTWQTEISPELIQAALERGTADQLVKKIAALLQSYEPNTPLAINLLSYRYTGALTDMVAKGQAGTYLAALRILLLSARDGQADIDGYIAAITPLLDDAKLGTSKTAALRALATAPLWLSYPEAHVIVQSDMLNRARKVLASQGGLPSDRPFSTADYNGVLEFVQAVRDELTTLEPADMIDVQGFLWLLFFAPKLWFVGTMYGAKEEKLEAFLANKLWGTGFGETPDIRSLIETGLSGNDDLKKSAKTQLEQAISEAGARKALLGLLDLASGADTVVIAKSTYRHTPTQTSVTRIKAVGLTRKGYEWRDDLGHTIQMDWRAQPGLSLDVGKYWSKINATVNDVEIETALDILASPVIAPPETVENAYSPLQDENIVTAPIPDLPLNLILFGPPGTGKTHRFLAKYRDNFADGRHEIVTFHPSFTYEEFVEGLRPVSDVSGQITYKVMPGVFRLLCERAQQDPARRYAILIDEINRANIAAVFGELITLIEEDKRGLEVTLPYSKTRFSIPKNLHIIGTMNTSDRSIALLDTALRRRFAFEEVGPDSSCLTGIIDGVKLTDVLDALNGRLTILYDRDHVIGHAWLMGVDTLEDLQQAFATKIIPLLREYFYDDWAKICLALREDPEKPGFVRKTQMSAEQERGLFGQEIGNGKPRILYDLTAPESWTAPLFENLARCA